ncbi:N-acetylglucosamine-6-phosphate deacetylase [Acholeplasma sp. OttesenSCG-928-E16]|nr:N-acetylglucosamine-6-phosphate deacetylase [Acholeplasma sp. OttesenSCG-928-E16]
MKIKNIKIILEDKIIESGIEIKDGKIQKIGFVEDGIDYSNYYLAPGFIDQHTHGAHGSDAMDGTIENLEEIAISLLKEGTTSFLATTMTMEEDKIKKAIQAVNDYKSDRGANILGVHFEGPFINKEKKGAQKEENIKVPSIDFIKRVNVGNQIKIVTIAPETKGALEVIRYLKDNNIVASIGHTAATANEVLEAIKAGATQVTHAYNAMSPFTHRQIGVVGAMLLYDELKAELICDGIHVSKEAIQLLLKNKGISNIFLITDAMRAKDIDETISELGGQAVYIKDNSARLEDGTLAGSILKMIDGIKNIIKFTNVSLVEAIRMASTNPAKNIGVYENKGSIAVNKDADLVILDQNLKVVKTIVAGKVLFENNN